MNRFLFLCKEIWFGKSVTRAFYNHRLFQEELQGVVVDVGGGKSPDYLQGMPRLHDVVFKTLDVKAGIKIDFEVDLLPYEDNSCDTVLFLNVLEHIYNYQHIANEVVRIVTVSGRVIGIVPFLMWYHPDPKDYFRYTHESLEKIFASAGSTQIHIEPIAYGPFTAAAQMVTQSMPRIFGVVFFALSYGLDSLFLMFRPGSGKRYVLGYYFEVKKRVT